MSPSLAPERVVLDSNARAPRGADLSWPADADDGAVLRTALAAESAVLVTDNRRDFPLGETRNGVLLLGTAAFLARLHSTYPEAESDLRRYVERQPRLPVAQR